MHAMAGDKTENTKPYSFRDPSLSVRLGVWRGGRVCGKLLPSFHQSAQLDSIHPQRRLPHHQRLKWFAINLHAPTQTGFLVVFFFLVKGSWELVAGSW